MEPVPEYASIDRVEWEWNPPEAMVKLPNGRLVWIKAADLPRNVRAGRVYRVIGGKFFWAEAEEKRREAAAEKLMDEVFVKQAAVSRARAVGQFAAVAASDAAKAGVFKFVHGSMKHK